MCRNDPRATCATCRWAFILPEPTEEAVYGDTIVAWCALNPRHLGLNTLTLWCSHHEYAITRTPEAADAPTY